MMRYNIINVNLDKKETFTSQDKYLAREEVLMSYGYKQLTTLKRKSCINTYFYKESEEK